MNSAVFDTASWIAVREQLASYQTLEDLRVAMVALAKEMSVLVFDACVQSGFPRHHRHFETEFWRNLGVHVVQATMRHSGGHCEEENKRYIFVNRVEHRWRQRFTAAHELGHLLLASACEELAMPSREEEILCEEFASELLIPSAELLEALGDAARPTPELLYRLCRQFRVNLQPMLIALEKTGCFKHVLAMLSQRRGHPQRLHEVDYRVDRCVGHRIVFLPRHKRLRSLGLPEVADWASSHPAGHQGTGSLQDVTFPLWDRAQGRGAGRGPVVWRAQTLAKGALLIFIDVSQLSYEWSQSNKRKRRIQ